MPCDFGSSPSGDLVRAGTGDYQPLRGHRGECIAGLPVTTHGDLERLWSRIDKGGGRDGGSEPQTDGGRQAFSLLPTGRLVWQIAPQDLVGVWAPVLDLMVNLACERRGQGQERLAPDGEAMCPEPQSDGRGAGEVQRGSCLRDGSNLGVFMICHA